MCLNASNARQGIKTNPLTVTPPRGPESLNASNARQGIKTQGDGAGKRVAEEV